MLVVAASRPVEFDPFVKSVLAHRPIAAMMPGATMCNSIWTWCSEAAEKTTDGLQTTLGIAVSGHMKQLLANKWNHSLPPALAMDSRVFSTPIEVGLLIDSLFWLTDIHCLATDRMAYHLPFMGCSQLWLM